MKIIIVGYGEMFRALITGVMRTPNEIVGVFLHDNVLKSPLNKFFSDLLSPSDDYNFIRTLKLHEIKARSVNSPEFINAVKELKADIILTGSWSEKFSAQTINSPKIACINLHPSLLPKYRGPNPYLQTILHNEKKTGITFHLMDINYDTGSILHQAEVKILDNDTGLSLKNKCCNVAMNEVRLLLNKLPYKIKNQKSQNEKEATYYHHISIAESILNFKKETALEIDRRIRALAPWMNCHIVYKNEFFTFKHHKICKEKYSKEPATIVKKNKNSVFIVCKDGKTIKFGDLQVKRPMSKVISGLYLRNIKVNEKAE